MTKKKHKILPPDMLDAFKYEIASELGLMTLISEDGIPESSEAGLAPTEGILPINIPDGIESTSPASEKNDFQGE